MRMEVENCYQCANYHVCLLRQSMEDVLDIGHHKLVTGSKSALKNSIPRPFFSLLAGICNVREIAKTD